MSWWCVPFPPLSPSPQPFFLLHCHALEMHPILAVLAGGKGYASPVTTNYAVLHTSFPYLWTCRHSVQILVLDIRVFKTNALLLVSPLPPNWNNPQQIFLHCNIPNSQTNLYFTHILVEHGWQVSIVGINVLNYLWEDIKDTRNHRNLNTYL